MASFSYNIAKYKLMRGELALHTADLRVALVKQFNTENPDQTTVAAVLDGTNNVECDFTNYARKTLTTKAVSQDDTNDRAELDYDDMVWSNAGGATNNTIRGAFKFVWVTTDADSIPVSYHDFGDTTTDGTDFTLAVGADGGLHLTG